jgi:sugar phosphate isomerase/epimerase
MKGDLMDSELSRRSFLATTAVAATAGISAAANKAAAKQAIQGSKAGRPKMKIGLYSMTYNGIWYRGDGMRCKEVMRFAKQDGWEGIEFETKRPQACPMNLSKDDRKELCDLAEELELPICAVSPNSDLSSHIPEHREAMLCYVRECIELTADLKSPICKVFTRWDGVIVRDGLGSYDHTRSLPDPYPQWTNELWDNVRDSLKELSQCAEDYGVILALQNHKPIVRNYKDVLKMIDEVASPAFKACMDLPCEGDNQTSDKWAREMVLQSKAVMVHSHFGHEFQRLGNGKIRLSGGLPHTAYPAFVDTLVECGYDGFLNFEFCHAAMENGKRASIDYVHNQARLAQEYMKGLRADAEAKLAKSSS